MGKNTVSEDDLLAGVGGGFGNIAQMGSGRPVRDNPFRDTRSEQPTPPAEARAQEAEAPPPSEPPERRTPRPRPLASQAPAPAEPTVSARAARIRPPKRQRKTDLYSEKISTFLSPEMRDELEAAARQLHRNRLVKGDSITVHTLIRSGVRVMTELLEFTDTDVVNSEEELYALIKRKLRF